MTESCGIGSEGEISIEAIKDADFSEEGARPGQYVELLGGKSWRRA